MTKLSEKTLRVSPRPTLWVLRLLEGIPEELHRSHMTQT